jgi:hypothetical protein
LPFLTEIDSRAAVKGSRDPLGFVPVWSRFGRRVVGNLTTVSNSVRGFTTLLLGYYFAELTQERFSKEAGSTLELFLKFEQLAAYSRYHAAGDRDFRGMERVIVNLAQTSKVKLGVTSDLQILSNQKIYGLWGLFSVPAKNSGLLQEDGRLTPAARTHVEKVLLPALAKGVPDIGVICALLKQPSATLHLAGSHEQLAAALAHVLRPKLTTQERAFYQAHLLQATVKDGTAGKQQQLAELLTQDGADDFDMEHLQRCIVLAARRRWTPLEEDLTAISVIEPLLIACEQLFALLCASDRAEFDTVIGDLGAAWGGGLRFLDLDELERQRNTIQDGYNEEKLATRLLAVARALNAGDFGSAARQLLEQNADIMSYRHGAPPWVRLERGRLKVTFLEETTPLWDAKDLQLGWRNTYFLNSLKRVAQTVRA